MQYRALDTIQNYNSVGLLTIIFIEYQRMRYYVRLCNSRLSLEIYNLDESPRISKLFYREQLDVSSNS